MDRRALARGLVFAAAVAATNAVVAGYSGLRLADSPARGRLQADPVGTLLTAVALLVSIGLFATLGRAIARDGGSRGSALRTGAFAGIFGGLAAGAIQAVASAPYLAAALSRVFVPEDFLAIALGIFVAFSAAVYAVVGGFVAWLAWS